MTKVRIGDFTTLRIGDFGFYFMLYQVLFNDIGTKNINIRSNS